MTPSFKYDRRRCRPCRWPIVTILQPSSAMASDRSFKSLKLPSAAISVPPHVIAYAHFCCMQLRMDCSCSPAAGW